MGIGGINNYSNLFGNYRVPSIPVVSVNDVAKQDREREAGESQATLSASSLQDLEAVQKPKKETGLEDISLNFNKGDDFGYIGKDSDIDSLDVASAVSDMQKDNVLKQYQYFVGSNSQGAIVDNADGVVVPKLY